MKKTFKLLHPATMMFMVILISYGLKAQPPTQYEKDTLDQHLEKRVDVNRFIKNETNLHKDENVFTKNYKFTGVTGKIDNTPQPIVINALVRDFYHKTIQVKMLADSDCRNQRCIGAVHIFYGMDSDKNVLLYQPLYLKHRSGKDYDTIHCDANYYVYENKTPTNPGSAKFTVAADAALTAYTKSIQIRTTAGGWRKINLATDSQGIIYSIQEIIQYYHAVYKSENPGEHYKEVLTIHHSAERYKIHPHDAKDSTTSIQHSLFFVDKNWKSTTKSFAPVLVLKTGDGVNLAHLCPPSCDMLTFPTK